MKHCRAVFFSVTAIVFFFNLITSSSAITMDKVIAVVGGEAITLSDYGRFVAKTDQAADREKVADNLLRGMIEERLIIQEAAKKGYVATEDEVSKSISDIVSQIGITEKELQERLGGEGISMTEYRQLLRENIVLLKCIESEVNRKVIVSESDAKLFYENNKSYFIETPEKVSVQAILMKYSASPSLTEITDLKIKSLRVYSEIKNGEPFERQVHKYSDEPFKSMGGAFGDFERGALIQALDERIFSMKEGEVSEPIWTKEGVYILRVLKKNHVAYFPFDAVKERVLLKLQEEKRDDIYKSWIKRLWEKSSVTIK